MLCGHAARRVLKQQDLGAKARRVLIRGSPAGLASGARRAKASNWENNSTTLRFRAIDFILTLRYGGLLKSVALEELKRLAEERS